VRLSLRSSWTRGSWSISDCRHGLSSAPEHAQNITSLFAGLRTFLARSTTRYGHLRLRSARVISRLRRVLAPHRML
jgi:hypothetical protein